MKSSLGIVALILNATIGLSYAHAACDVQSVAISSGRSELARWDVIDGEIHPITLPNGLKLGLQIAPAPEKTREFAEKLPAHSPVELVKISLYDLAGDEAKPLTYTYGGVDSIQGYGPSGGAAKVSEVGEPGIVLELKKQKCSPTA